MEEKKYFSFLDCFLLVFSPNYSLIPMPYCLETAADGGLLHSFREGTSGEITASLVLSSPSLSTNPMLN